jgi:RNA polymerase sigma-70 factor (ECF subfamily)
MDDSRFGAVVSPHIKNMVYLAIAMLGQADAEDAVQEALVRAWQAQSRLREGDTVRAWLLTITANVCRDLLRGRHGTRARLTTTFPDQSEESPNLVASSESDPGSNNSAERFDLRQLVDLLEENLREIVVLRFYVEMNATEIGAVLGLPPSTIRTRLQRALTHLRTLIAQHEVYLQPRVNS